MAKKSDAKPSSAAKKERSTEEIQADIDQTRARLVDNIDKLKAETSPQALMAKAKAKAHDVFFNPETGVVRTERVVAVAIGVVGIIIVRRGLKARARRRELQRLREVVWVPVPRSAVSPEVAKVARNAKELSAGPAVIVTSDDLAKGRVPLAIEAAA
ncbi:MAG: DUF3618 domain-containing protein [Actinobacteria bacterium]|nr:DUF3618 domain-containing protein [Actinomycetota bacterium]